MSVIMATRGAAIRRPDVYTKLLLRGDGYVAAIKEMCGKTVTVYGDTTQQTAYRKFLGGALTFDGTGDYLALSDSDDFYINGDFTLECFVRFTNLPSNGNGKMIFSQVNGGKYIQFYLWNSNDGAQLYRIVCVINGSEARGVFTIYGNIWYHVAAVRTGSTLKVYCDGTAGAVTVSVTPSNIAASVYVGANNASTPLLSGQIDELRFSKGICRYTAAFTPPTRRF